MKRQQQAIQPARQQTSVIQIPDVTQRPPGAYDRRATGFLSVDFAYKPASFRQEMVAGGYGEPVSYLEVMQVLGQYPAEEFLGVCVVGTDAARQLGKRVINHFQNYGFGRGFVFDTTKIWGMIPLTDAMGCGNCPGDTIVISPGVSFASALDTAWHEHKHNVGWKHPQDKDGNDIHNPLTDPIYIEARRVAGYLSQFPEA